MTEYEFFKFSTSENVASNNGYVRGMVNKGTGEINATQTFGLLWYRENYHLNINDSINSFAHTLKDRIILEAKKAIRERN